MRIAVAALAITLSSTVTANGATRDPLALVLTRADVASARLADTGRGPAAVEQGLRKVGIRTRAAHYAYVQVPAPGPHNISVTGIVIAANRAADARRVFTFLRRESLRRGRAVELSRFGDEQLATHTTTASEDVLVRRNTIVWALSIRAAGAEELSWAHARPEMVEYAAKKRRVGAG